MNNSFIVLATINLSLGGLVFLLGLLILRENPRQRVNQAVALMLFLGGVGSLLSALTLLSQTGAPTARTAAAQSFQSLTFLWEFFFPTVFWFASVFPEERSYVRRGGGLQRLVPWAPPFGVLVFLPHIVHLLALAVLGFVHPGVPKLEGPLEIVSPLLQLGALLLELFLAVHRALFSMVNLGFGNAAVVLFAESLRRARAPRLRQQIQVIGMGLAACLALYSAASVIPTLLGQYWPLWLRSLLTAAALTTGSGAIAYAIVRFKFLDVKLLARRAILYGLVSASLIGLYLLGVGQLNRLLVNVAPVQRQVLEPVFLVVALILFQPTISRLEELLDRSFLRDPGDYRNVLRALAKDVLTTIELDELLDRSIRTVGEALLLRSAHVVAITSRGLMTHTGAGTPIELRDHELLRTFLLRLSVLDPSVRIADLWVGLAPGEREAIVDRLGIALVIPLRSRGETVGALLLGPKLTGTEFNSEDVSLLTGLAGTMGVSLQNALLVRERVEVARLDEELRLARQIQRSFLHTEFPRMRGVDVHALNIPSKAVGGDLYDVVPAGDGAFVLAIADVAGKGVPAALLSSMLQASLRTQASSIASVTEILRNINSLVYRGATVHQFATFFIARMEPAHARLTFSNAGHNYPVLMRRGGEQLTLECGGTVLGILESTEYEEETVTLQKGDRLVFYTDGITEAGNPAGELYGEERLYALLRDLPHEVSAREATERILAGLEVFRDGQEAADDVTLMVVQVMEETPSVLEEQPAAMVETAATS